MRRELNLDNPVGHGGVLLEEGRVLTALAAAHGGPVLEIGAATGCSTRFILDGLPPGDGLALVSVDPKHEGRFEDPRLHREHCLSDRIERSYNPGDFAWAFIDGSHEAPWPAHDLALVQRLGVRFAVLHDSNWSGWPDVRTALDESGLPYCELNTGCGLAIVRFR